MSDRYFADHADVTAEALAEDQAEQERNKAMLRNIYELRGLENEDRFEVFRQGFLAGQSHVMGLVHKALKRLEKQR